MSYLMYTIISFMIGVFTLTGDVQKIVYFSDPLGELAFCVVSFMLSMLFFTAWYDSLQTVRRNK